MHYFLHLKRHSTVHILYGIVSLSFFAVQIQIEISGFSAIKQPITVILNDGSCFNQVCGPDDDVTASISLGESSVFFYFDGIQKACFSHPIDLYIQYYKMFHLQFVNFTTQRLSIC